MQERAATLEGAPSLKAGASATTGGAAAAGRFAAAFALTIRSVIPPANRFTFACVLAGGATVVFHDVWPSLSPWLEVALALTIPSILSAISSTGDGRSSPAQTSTSLLMGVSAALFIDATLPGSPPIALVVMSTESIGPIASPPVGATTDPAPDKPPSPATTPTTSSPQSVSRPLSPRYAPLDREALRGMLRARRTGVEQCGNTRVRAGQSINGTLSIEFTLLENGESDAPRVVGDIPISEFIECVKQVYRKISIFRPLPRSYRVVYPIHLQLCADGDATCGATAFQTYTTGDATSAALAASSVPARSSGPAVSISPPAPSAPAGSSPPAPLAPSAPSTGPGSTGATEAQSVAKPVPSLPPKASAPGSTVLH